MLFVEDVITTEEIREWLSVSFRFDCLTGTDDLHRSLSLITVKDVEDLAERTIGFAPGVWLNLLLGSGNGFGAVSSESAYASADSNYYKVFPHVSKMSSVRSTKMFRMTRTIILNLVACGIRTLLDARKWGSYQRLQKS